MRVPFPTLVRLAYEQTELFLRKLPTPPPKLRKPARLQPEFRARARACRGSGDAGFALRCGHGQHRRRVRHGPVAPRRSSTHAEQSISEDAITAAARERADDSGAGAVTPAVGALLSVLAKLAGAKAVVEVGTGAGVSGLWLLSGMRDDGVLTTIDVEPEHQRLAKQAFAEAGIGPSRTRLISGRAQDVLTRLADDSYDLVFIDADPVDQPQFVVEGIRLLRSGGAIVVHRAALGGRAGDASASDKEVTAVREAARLIAEDERLTPVLIPLGDGLLAAARD